MPRSILTPAMIRGAVWLWGDKATAAKRLGVSAAVFRKMEAGDAIPTSASAKVINRYQRLSADQRYGIEHGDKLMRAMSDKQRSVMKRRGFKGKRFMKATRQYIRREKDIPHTVGDFFDEIYG